VPALIQTIPQPQHEPQRKYRPKLQLDLPRSATLMNRLAAWFNDMGYVYSAASVRRYEVHTKPPTSFGAFARSSCDVQLTWGYDGYNVRTPAKPRPGFWHAERCRKVSNAISASSGTAYFVTADVTTDAAAENTRSFVLERIGGDTDSRPNCGQCDGWLWPRYSGMARNLQRECTGNHSTHRCICTHHYQERRGRVVRITTFTALHQLPIFRTMQNDLPALRASWG